MNNIQSNIQHVLYFTPLVTAKYRNKYVLLLTTLERNPALWLSRLLYEFSGPAGLSVHQAAVHSGARRGRTDNTAAAEVEIGRWRDGLAML